MLLNPYVRGLYAYVANHVLGIRVRRSPLIDLGKPVLYPTPHIRWHNNLWIIRGPQNILLIAPAGISFYSLIGEARSFNTLFHIAKPGMVFLDIGAGVGSYAIPFAKKGLRVFAVEPDSLSTSLLRMNARANNVRINVVQTIVSQTTGRTYYCYQHFLASHTCHVKKALVNSKPLDDIVQELKVKPDIIKIDVDGAEINVVQSGINTIKNAKYILIEASPYTVHEINLWMKKIRKKAYFTERMWSKGVGLLRLPVQTSSFMILYIDQSIYQAT